MWFVELNTLVVDFEQVEAFESDLSCNLKKLTIHTKGGNKFITSNQESVEKFHEEWEIYEREVS